jgi:hypothetical protein
LVYDFNGSKYLDCYGTLKELSNDGLSLSDVQNRKLLGTKDIHRSSIERACRKLALPFHPDKHHDKNKEAKDFLGKKVKVLNNHCTDLKKRYGGSAKKVIKSPRKKAPGKTTQKAPCLTGTQRLLCTSCTIKNHTV